MSWIKGLARHSYTFLEEMNGLFALRPRKGFVVPASFNQPGPSNGNIYLPQISIIARQESSALKLPVYVKGNLLGPKQYAMTLYRRFGTRIQDDPHLSRDFLVQLWVADKKLKRSRDRQMRKRAKYAKHHKTVLSGQPSFQLPFGRWLSSASLTRAKPYDQAKPGLKQPPPSQSVTGILEPTSSEEVNLGAAFIYHFC